MLEFWNAFVTEPTGAFIIIFIGTMLLFAEVLVRGRLIFGIVGIATIALYFTAHSLEGQILWMSVLYVVGIMLVVIDGKFLGDGTLGAIGLVAMVVALALPSPNFLHGVAVASAFIIGALCSLIFLKFFPRRGLWTKLALKDSLSSEQGYNSVNEGYTQLVGKEGIAQTDFRPTGTMKVDGKMYSASSEGVWIGKGSRVKVSQVSGTRILVEKIEEEDEENSY